MRDRGKTDLLPSKSPYSTQWSGRKFTIIHYLREYIPWGFHYKFSIVPINIPASFVIDIYKMIPKFTWKDNGNRITKTVLKKKSHFLYYLFISQIDLTTCIHIFT